MNRRSNKQIGEAGEPQPLPPGPKSIARIEELTKAALLDGSFEQHVAFLELLTYINLDSYWAHYARMAVIRLSDELLSEAADLLVLKEQVTREPQKGGSNG